MSKYVKKKTEDLMKIGSDETLFSDSKKTYYPSPWWKFWDRDKRVKSETTTVMKEGVRYSLMAGGYVRNATWNGYKREFDKEGNLVSVSRGEESLDVKSGIITINRELAHDAPSKSNIVRIYPDGTYDDTFYFKDGRRMVSAGHVDDKGFFNANRIMEFDSNGKQTSSEWLGKKVVARGKLKEMLQEGLSAGALEEKARKLKGLKGTSRINASKKSYSGAREEMHKEQEAREETETRKKISLRQNRRYGDYWG